MMPGALTVTATATLSDGTTQTVTPVWTIDDPRVASVDSAGRVTTVAPGAATVVATFEAQTARMPLRVTPNFNGVWSGSYRQVACDAPDTTACRTNQLAPPPDQRLTARFQQRASIVTGRLEFLSNGQVGTAVDVLGAVTLDGRLELDGAQIAANADGRLVGWRSSLEQPGLDTMRGGFATVGKALGDGPIVHITYALDALARTSGGGAR
jgi:hypothetical protein